jgi:hypothetical protein
MKVTFKGAIGSYSGYYDQMVFSPTPNKLGSIARRWVKPAVTPQQSVLKTISANLKVIWTAADAAYKQDLKDYATKINVEMSSSHELYTAYTNGYAEFVRMMYAWRDIDVEHVFLETVSVADIVSIEAPVVSVIEAITAGLLVNVPGSETMDSPIDGV